MKMIMVAMLALLATVMAGCDIQPAITSFEECVAAGNPVMESYPRQCSADGQTFVEEIEVGPKEFTECKSKPEVCTLEYAPVCGIIDNGIRCVTTPCQSTDAVTYGNGCGACGAGAFGYYSGECIENTFVVCTETVTGFDPVKFAADVNGICVDICPGNYNPYVTQIGVEICIEHYGVDEISTWETCDRSSETCRCVKAYETTSDEPIENAVYRCVPDRYAERLLFRGGQDFLDENGDQSVVIA